MVNTAGSSSSPMPTTREAVSEGVVPDEVNTPRGKLKLSERDLLFYETGLRAARNMVSSQADEPATEWEKLMDQKMLAEIDLVIARLETGVANERTAANALHDQICMRK